MIDRKDAPMRQERALLDWLTMLRMMPDTDITLGYCRDVSNLTQWWPLADVEQALDAVGG